MSALDKFLELINPVSNAEATPQFFGENGYPYKNVNKAAFATALGKSPDEIWQKYHLYREPNRGGFLGEIDDSNAKLRTTAIPGSAPEPSLIGFLKNAVTGELPQPKQQVVMHGPLSQVLDHPALLNGQKELSRIPVKMLDIKQGEDIRPEGLTIFNKDTHFPLGIQTKALPNEMLSSLLHELTHAKNGLYGGAIGSNTDKQTYNDYWNSPGEQAARLTQMRLTLSKKQRQMESPLTTLKKLQSIEPGDYSRLFK